MKAQGKVPTDRHALPHLWQIAADGNVEQLETILSLGANINAFNPSGLTALMVAAYHGRSEMVKALIENGADVNAADGDGLTAATMADKAGYNEIVRVLGGNPVKRRPSAPVSEAASIQATEEELPDLSSESVSAVGQAPQIRTLHEPPDIWDMVQEAPADFNPGSAFFGRLPVKKILAPLAMLLVIGSAGLLGFNPLRRWLSAGAPPSGVRAEDNEKKASVSPIPLTKTVKVTSNQRPVKELPREKMTSSAIFNPRNITAGATGVRSTQVSTEGQPIPNVLAARATPASSRSEETSDTRKPVSRVVNRPTTAAKVENLGSQLSMNPGYRSENERRASPVTIKRDVGKATSPESSPPKSSPSPRGKVIEWP